MRDHVKKIQTVPKLRPIWIPVECMRCHQITSAMEKYCRTCGINMKENVFTKEKA